jgi:hypothetical protein
MIDIEVLKGNLIIVISAIFGFIPLNITDKLADPTFVSLTQSYVTMIGILVGVFVTLYKAFKK